MAGSRCISPLRSEHPENESASRTSEGGTTKSPSSLTGRASCRTPARTRSSSRCPRDVSLSARLLQKPCGPRTRSHPHWHGLHEGPKTSRTVQMATRLRLSQGLGGDGLRLGIAPGRGQLRLCQTSFVVGKGSAHRKRPSDLALCALKIAAGTNDPGNARPLPRVRAPPQPLLGPPQM